MRRVAFVVIGFVVVVVVIAASLGLFREWVDRILGDDDGGWLAKD